MSTCKLTSFPVNVVDAQVPASANCAQGYTPPVRETEARGMIKYTVIFTLNHSPKILILSLS